MTYKQYNRHIKLCKLNNKPLTGDYLIIKEHLYEVTKGLRIIGNDYYGNDLGSLYGINHDDKTIWCYHQVYRPLQDLNIPHIEGRIFIRKKLLPFMKELDIEDYRID